MRVGVIGTRSVESALAAGPTATTWWPVRASPRRVGFYSDELLDEELERPSDLKSETQARRVDGSGGGFETEPTDTLGSRGSFAATAAESSN